MEKILITGTGRCGTTFLIKLFTFLGFDTGFDSSTYRHHIHGLSNSGMEMDARAGHEVIKNPCIMRTIEDVVRDVKIKCVIIPIRDYEPAARSRVRLGNGPGGLLGAHDLASQILFFHANMANYLRSMVRHEINTIFLDFDRMVSDVSYLRNKLKSLTDEKHITDETFEDAYNFASRTSRPVAASPG